MKSARIEGRVRALTNHEPLAHQERGMAPSDSCERSKRVIETLHKC